MPMQILKIELSSLCFCLCLVLKTEVIVKNAKLRTVPVHIWYMNYIRFTHFAENYFEYQVYTVFTKTFSNMGYFFVIRDTKSVKLTNFCEFMCSSHKTNQFQLLFQSKNLEIAKIKKTAVTF